MLETIALGCITKPAIALITKHLSGKVIDHVGRRVRDYIKGTDKEQAIERCINASIIAIYSSATSQEPEETKLLGDIFRDFFCDEDVAIEVASLLKGKKMNREDLMFLFSDKGFDAHTLPGLDLNTCISVFETTFVEAAILETNLQGIIQTAEIIKQTDIQQALHETIIELCQFLKQSHSEIINIYKGQINILNSVTNEQKQFLLKSEQTFMPKTNWEAHYLRTLLNQSDLIDLSLIDEKLLQGGGSDCDLVVHVTDVYTTLNLKHFLRNKDEKVADILLKRNNPHDTKSFNIPITRDIPIQAIEAIAAMDRLVILSQPGGGKSTIVNHVTSQLARRLLKNRQKDEKLADWPNELNPIPVRIILRRFAAFLPEFPSNDGAGLVWDYIRHNLKQLGCEEAFENLKIKLIEEGGIIFFDGLDEVSENDEFAKRTLIVSAIRAFSMQLEKAKIIITCREYAYKNHEQWRLSVIQFPVVELSPFDLNQIKQFTNNWYQVTGTSRGWDLQKCLKEANVLNQALTEFKHLQHLGQQPLLLTLMAQIHGRDGYLPNDRADLYERVVNLLLAHWENRIVRDYGIEKKVEPGLILQLDIRMDLLRSVLESVAFKIHEKQGADSKRDESSANIPKILLLDELYKVLGSYDKAVIVIGYLQERTGLLLAKDNETYAFPHRTFQEYLAATYIMKQGDYPMMFRERILRDPLWWREVFLLAIGTSKRIPKAIADIVDELIPTRPESFTISEEKASYVIISGQALVDVNFVEFKIKEEKERQGRYTETYKKIIKWLELSMSTDASVTLESRYKAGDILAQLGDPRPEVVSLDEMQFCFIPKGPFFMAKKSEFDEDAIDYEKPLERKPLNYSYWISRYPITGSQFQVFVNAENGYEQDQWWTIEGLKWKSSQPKLNKWKRSNALLNHPAVEVSWYESIAFTRWFEYYIKSNDFIQDPFTIKLPSEIEWEKASRGGIDLPVNELILSVKGLQVKPKIKLIKNKDPYRIYPWGDQEDNTKSNNDETGIFNTNAVGTFPSSKSPYGCEEMSGNVSEWCGQYIKTENNLYVKDIRQSKSCIIRGGGLDNPLRFGRCSHREWTRPTFQCSDIGFRIVLRPK